MITVSQAGVIAGRGRPPVNTAAPHITGTPSLASLLSGSNGVWTGAASFTYQWYRDGLPIGGGTAANYQPVDVDLGKQGSETNPVLGFAVTAHGPGGSTTVFADNTVQFSETTALGALFKAWIRGSGITVSGTDVTGVTDASPAGNNLSQPTAGNRPTRIVNDVGLFAIRFAIVANPNEKRLQGPVLSSFVANDGAGHGTAYWSLAARTPRNSNLVIAPSPAAGYAYPGQGVDRQNGYAWFQSLGKTGTQLYVQAGAYSAAAGIGKGATANVDTNVKTLVQGSLTASDKKLRVRVGWGAEVVGDTMTDTLLTIAGLTVWGSGSPQVNSVDEDLHEQIVCSAPPSAAVQADIRAAMGVRQNISSNVTYTPALANVQANSWDNPQAYGRFWSGGAMFVFTTNANTIKVRYYVTNSAIEPTYGAIGVLRGALGAKYGNVIVTNIVPTPITGMYEADVAIGGVADSTRQVWVINGALSGFIGAQVQAIIVDVSKTFAWVPEPADGQVYCEGWGSRLMGGNSANYNLGDGYVVEAGVIVDGPGNAYLNLRNTCKGRITRANPKYGQLRLGTNDGNLGVAASDYKIALKARIVDWLASAPLLTTLYVCNPRKRSTIGGGSTLPPWYASYETATSEAVTEIGDVRVVYHNAENDTTFANLSVLDGVHDKDEAAAIYYVNTGLEPLDADHTGRLMHDADSIGQGSANPSIHAMTEGVPQHFRTARAV